MKIGIIQASSQKEKNDLLFEIVKEAVKGKEHEVFNFGIFSYEDYDYSYIQIAICISLLLESQAVDFIVTGCSSGQGIMLACNSLPGILCGYIENPSDAFLFRSINDGNVVSLPLGLNFGWAGEINLQCTLGKLFDGPFGIGYPKEDAKRKQRDTKLLKELNQITKKNIFEIMPLMENNLLMSTLQRQNVYNFIKENGKKEDIIRAIDEYLENNKNVYIITKKEA